VIEFDLRYPTDEASERLQRITADPGLGEPERGEALLVGVVREGRFRVQARTSYRDSLATQCVGRIAAAPGGCRVEAAITPSGLALLFLAAWCGIVMYVASRVQSAVSSWGTLWEAVQVGNSLPLLLGGAFVGIVGLLMARAEADTIRTALAAAWLEPGGARRAGAETPAR
jgi:hypothetical protein